METVFGFLTQPGTYSVDLPDNVDPAYEQVAAVGFLPQETLNVQCASSGRIDFSKFGWRRGFEVDAGSTTVDVYECDDPPDVIMPVWRVDHLVIWMQLRGKAGRTRGEMLASFIGGLRPHVDAQGIPRISLSGGIVRANPVLHATGRDAVLFRLVGSTQMLTIRNDGALGKEGRFTDGDSAWASATTGFGITVERDGGVDERDELYEEVARIARTIKQAA